MKGALHPGQLIYLLHTPKMFTPEYIVAVEIEITIFIWVVGHLEQKLEQKPLKASAFVFNWCNFVLS
jgi:hypothetical protein